MEWCSEYVPLRFHASRVGVCTMFRLLCLVGFLHLCAWLVGVAELPWLLLGVIRQFRGSLERPRKPPALQCPIKCTGGSGENFNTVAPQQNRQLR